MNVPWRQVSLVLLALVLVVLAVRYGFHSQEDGRPSAQAAGAPKTEEALVVPDSAIVQDTTQPRGPATRSENPTPAEVMQSVLEELDSAKRRAALQDLALHTAQRDPQHAWGMLDSVKGLADRQIFAATVARAWAEKSPQEALQAVSSLPPGELRAECYAAAVGAWAGNAPADAMQFVTTQLEGSARQMAASRVAAAWARRDPSTAANWALANSGSEIGLGAVVEVMEFWGDTDPETGLAWASALPDSPFKKQAVQSVLLTWADQFPEEAAAYISRSGLAGDTAAIIASVWAKSDPAAAVAWASGLPTGSERENALREAVSSWSASAPLSALEWAAGQDNHAYVASILKAWAAENAGAAYQWASSRPEGATLIEPVLQSWSEQNPQAFLGWANSIPEPQRTDTMLGLMALASADSSPRQAVKYAESITNRAQKSELMERVLGAWEQADPAAVAAWRRHAKE